MSGEPRWLEADEVIQLNRMIVADTGEDHIVKDRGLLESALARPRHLLALSADEPDALEMAVSIRIGISRNHPFIQGNKRTAFAAMEIFLYHAGYELRVPDKVEIADFQVAVIEHQRTEEDFLLMLDEHLYERSAFTSMLTSLIKNPIGGGAISAITIAHGGVVTNALKAGSGEASPVYMAIKEAEGIAGMIRNPITGMVRNPITGMVRNPITGLRPGKDIFGPSKKDSGPDDEEA
ncbi:type II toxin-antitoxin system death-on-curing family toxin [Sphingomonas sp. SAFR-052]|uniref:type II toxin-antitoxin system death-on-curing family toxin n=1 Tax=Sphingomonas sp. SAFR-052 TaxID=3436867 RepID=UPI003F7DD5E5